MTKIQQYEDSELVSSTSPDVVLDLEQQLKDVNVLKKLKYIANKPIKTANEIVGQIEQEINNVSFHQELEQYIFSRYKAVSEDLRLKTNLLQQIHDQNELLKSQIIDKKDSCQSCKQYASMLQQLQEQMGQPCPSCLLLKQNIQDVIKKLQESKEQLPLQISNDLQKIYVQQFKQPQNYVFGEKSQELINEVMEIQKVAANYLQRPNELQSDMSTEVINAFNRATTKLKEKDEQILQLKQNLSKIQNQDQLINQQVQIPDASQQLFIELINQELYNQQTPQDEQQFITQKFSKNVVIRKSIADLARETLLQLSQSFGRNDLQIEQALQPPVLYIREQLNEKQLKIIEEVQRIGSLIMTLRYSLQSCLEFSDPQRIQETELNKQQMTQQQLLQQQHQFIKSTSLILKSLFNMCLWQEQSFLKKGFGTLTSNELIKLVNQTETGLPQGFFDEQIIKEVNDIFLNINQQEIGDSLEKLSTILQELQYKYRLLPNICGDLSKIAVELEQTNKQLQQKIQEKESLIQDLKEIIKQENAAKQDLLQQLQSKDLQINQFTTEMSKMKNQMKELEVQNKRLPELEQILEQHIKACDQFKRENIQQGQQIESQKIQLEQLGKQYNQTLEKCDQYENRINQMNVSQSSYELQQRELVQSRQDVVGKNRELVQLCKGMEQRIKEQENEIMECKRLIGQEMPILQESYQKQRVLNENLQNELQQIQNEKRKLTEQNKDQELALTKMQQQFTHVMEENEERGKSYSVMKKEHTEVTEEVERITQLFLAEQQKSIALGSNLDRISERNIEVERMITKLTAENEHLKADHDAQMGLLMEANASLKVQQEQLFEAKSKYEEQVQIFAQTQKTQATNLAENEMMKQTVARLDAQIKEQRINFDTELGAKQKMLTELTTQISQLTMTVNGQEGRTQIQARSQYTQEMQQYLDAQAQQHAIQTQKMEQDNSILVQELTTCKADQKQKTKEIAKLTKENDMFKVQLQQITEIQEKLAEKSKKLLKTTTQLKTKCIALIKGYERISAYSNGVFDFQLANASILGTVASNLSLQDIQPDNEMHAGDILKIANPSEVQMKKLCDIIQQGVELEQVQAQLKECCTQRETLDKQIQVLNYNISDAEKRATEAETKVKEQQSKISQFQKTINTLSLKITEQQQVKEQVEAQAILAVEERSRHPSIHSERHSDHHSERRQVNESVSDDIPLDEMQIMAKPHQQKEEKNPQMTSSNLDKQKEQYQQPKSFQISSVDDGQKKTMKQMPLPRIQSQKAVSDYIPLSMEEQLNIQKLLKKNQAVQDQVVPVTLYVGGKK